MKIDVSKVKGIENMTEMLSKATVPAMKEALYDGAAVFYEAMRRATEALPVNNDYQPREGPRKRGITRIQKEGLIDGLFVGKFKNEDGAIETYIGFAGYNRLKSKRYPNGQPNILIRRSISKGTTYLQPDKTIQKAVKNKKKQAVQRIQETLNKRMAEELK